MELYYLPGTAAMAAMAALEEAGAAYDPVRVVREDGRTVFPPDYRRISPHERVPALVDGDVALHESAAIVLHVGERFPASALLPPTATTERSDLYRWLMYLTNTVQATFMLRFYPERVVGSDDASAAALVAGVDRQLNEMFDWIEASLEQGGYLLEGGFSGADLYLHMVTRWGRRLDRQPWTLPALGDHYRRLSERPSVARMLELQGIVAYPEN